MLELGSQDINHDVPLEDIRRTLMKIHRDTKVCEKIFSEYFTETQTWKVSNLFRYSKFHYASIDDCPGDFIVQVDLNTMSVSADSKIMYDLITNFGTTEQVTDQVNVFRVIHVFFLFLSHANEYEVSSLQLSPPHIEYNIPTVEWLPGSEGWKDVLFQSGIVSCMLRKIHDKPFALFTDYDRSVITDQASFNLAKALDGRYDLRVRSESSPYGAGSNGRAAQQELQRRERSIVKWIGSVINDFLKRWER